MTCVFGDSERVDVPRTSSSRLAQPLGDGYPRQWALVRLKGTEYSAAIRLTQIDVARDRQVSTRLHSGQNRNAIVVSVEKDVSNASIASRVRARRPKAIAFTLTNITRCTSAAFIARSQR